MIAMPSKIASMTNAIKVQTSITVMQYNEKQIANIAERHTATPFRS